MFFLASVSLCFNLSPVSASSSEKPRDDYTFGEIETILVDYLNEKGYTFGIGSPEFTNYVIEQMNTDSDNELAKREDYHLICAYFAEYLYRLSLFEVQNSDGNYMGFAEQTFKMDDSIKNTTLGEMKQDIEKEEQSTKLIEQLPNAIMATGTINLDNARAYAEKYYKNYNRAYPEFSLDCTNFVSQILAAGGKRMVTRIDYPALTSDTQYWFIRQRPDNSWSRSTSWTVVPDLYSHLVRTQIGYSSTSKSSIISNAKSGDVIQFKRLFSYRLWLSCPYYLRVDIMGFREAFKYVGRCL